MPNKSPILESVRVEIQLRSYSITTKKILLVLDQS